MVIMTLFILLFLGVSALTRNLKFNRKTGLRIKHS